MSRFKIILLSTAAALLLVAVQSQATWIYNPPSSGSSSGVSSLTAGAGIQLSGSTGAITVSSTPKTFYFVIENPTASEDNAIFVFNQTSTIQSVKAVNKTNGDTATFNLVWASSRQTATSSAQKAFTSYQTVTATTTPTSVSVNGSSTVPSGYVMRLVTSAASSSQLLVTVNYTD